MASNLRHNSSFAWRSDGARLLHFHVDAIALQRGTLAKVQGRHGAEIINQSAEGRRACRSEVPLQLQYDKRRAFAGVQTLLFGFEGNACELGRLASRTNSLVAIPGGLHGVVDFGEDVLFLLLQG